MEGNAIMRLALSAIVPVYNAGKYLNECLNSIINQTDTFCEVILINDGSIDDSKRICEEYCRKYDYFILIDQRNAGPSEARNVGIRWSQGDYVVFIDADDIVKDNMVSKLKEILVKNDYDMVLYNADIFYEERYGEPQNYFKRNESFYGKDMRGTDYLKASFPADFVVSPCVAAYKKQFIQDNQIYFQKGIYFEDNDFCLRVYLLAQKITCMDETLYIRRCHNHSIMADKNMLKKCQDLIKVNLTIWDILVKSEIDILFQIHFVSYYFINAWNTIRQSNYYEEVKHEWCYLLAAFRNKWLKKYLSVDIGFDDMVAVFLYAYGCRKRNLPSGIEEENIRKKLKNELMIKLEKIPLSCKDVKVGIYGTGRHTEKMMQAYEKYIGKIQSNIFFIVTENIQKLDHYGGYSLVTCTDIPCDVDFIVLSSLPFQQDMYNQLVKEGISPKKIIELYINNEFCDLIILTELLEIQ